MLYDLGLITRYATLASAGITYVSLDHSAATVSENSSSHDFLPIAGAIGLLLMLGVIVAVILLVRHKQALSRDESGGQPGSTLFSTRPGYGQDYSRRIISAEQEPWPWARKPAQPVSYNPVTPIPETLRVPAIPTTPVSEMLRTPAIPVMPVPEVPVAPVVPMQNPLQQPPVLVPDPALEEIMRQVQVGLFAMPVQHKGQKDREAVL